MGWRIYLNAFNGDLYSIAMLVSKIFVLFVQFVSYILYASEIKYIFCFTPNIGDN
jgi:hypothetical protein